MYKSSYRWILSAGKAGPIRYRRLEPILPALEFEGIDHVVADEFEIRIREEVRDILLPSREKVIKADDLIAFLEKSLTKMGAKKPGSSGD